MPNKRRFSNTITSIPCHLPLMTTVMNLTLRHVAHFLVAILSAFLTLCFFLEEMNTDHLIRMVVKTLNVP